MFLGHQGKFFRVALETRLPYWMGEIILAGEDMALRRDQSYRETKY